jgi:hypothetical protein
VDHGLRQRLQAVHVRGSSMIAKLLGALLVVLAVVYIFLILVHK